MTADDVDRHGFSDWAQVEHLLTHEPWEWVLVRRPDGTSLTLHTRYDGRLAFVDAELTQHDRSQLCRWSFVPRNVPGSGRLWVWAPPSSTRPPRRGQGPRVVAPGLVLWACLSQRDRKAVRVLRELLAAAPEDLVVRLECEDDVAV